MKFIFWPKPKPTPVTRLTLVFYDSEGRPYTEQQTALLMHGYMRGLLEECESFISGFEDDPLQEGLDDLLARLRYAIEAMKQEAA